jgi:hypothetical protein
MSRITLDVGDDMLRALRSIRAEQLSNPRETTTTAELSDVDDDEVVRDLLLEAYRSELKKESRSGASGPIGAERRYSSE